MVGSRWNVLRLSVCPAIVMGKRSRSRSSSPHRSRKHKTSHSRERRRRSRSRGHEKHKSRSRDRKTERERRQSDGNGSERRRSSSRQNQSRSSDGHRRRQSRSKSRDKSREPARRNSSDSDKTKSLSSAEKAKSTEKGTPDISSFSEMVRILHCHAHCHGYRVQTPAERVRAKLKVMLDKATASAVIPEENVVSATPPSEAQIRDIDSDVFTTESFVSTREKRKEQQVQSQSANHLITSFPRRSKEKVEDEYAPQVVELLENTDSGGIDHPMEQNVPAENAQPIAATTSVLETPAEEKKRKWLEKLQKLRQGLASAN
ncbi:hypothetical protein EMCRGX_G025205 [Ephydatia muelleri]